MDIPRLVFFGTPAFAVPSLARLLKAGLQIQAVVTASDKPVGRRRILMPPPIKTLADAYGIPVWQPTTLKDDTFYERFAALSPTLCVVVAYGKRIPPRFLDVPPLGFLNLHPSLLPRWRGPSPIRTAILHGESETGISVMELDADMDHGPVLVRQHISLDGTEYAHELEPRFAEQGAHLLADAVARHLVGAVTSVSQRHEDATFSTKFTRQDGHLDWHEPAIRISQRIRALSAEPGTWATHDGRVFNILRARAHPHQQPQTHPGTLLGYEHSLLVGTSDGVVELESIQPEGKRPLTAQEFLNGYRSLLGSRFS
jgi:methionyl-tRNA formyltransferase